MARKRNVVFGIAGSTLDRRGGRAKRWERWRPTVDVCRQAELKVDRFELLCQPGDEGWVASLTADMREVSPRTQVVVREIRFEDPWDFEEVYSVLHQCCREYAFDQEREHYLAHITTGTHVAQICWFLLCESRHFPGRLLQVAPPATRGDAGSHSVIDLDLSKYDRLASRFAEEQLAGQAVLKSGIETRNDRFNQLIEEMEHVALASQAPILITGPTGAGKSRLARSVYRLKRDRAQVTGPLVEVNCATLRGDLAMSTLFGHKRGAFTGAVRDHQGVLQAADGGLLFLDEIGELGADEQAMLLRALEQKVFLPVGAEREVASSFQLVAGTNRDLHRLVDAGRFREDLLARINLWHFDLPGLCDRPEDLEPNLDYELARWADEHGRRIRFESSARQLFLRFAQAPDARWSGNFRDLNAAVVRMATLAPGGRITDAQVRREIARLNQSWGGARGSVLEAHLSAQRLEAIDLFDRLQLEQVIRVCQQESSLSAAGRRLFGASRTRRRSTNDADRLRKYLARFDLNWASLTQSSG